MLVFHATGTGGQSMEALVARRLPRRRARRDDDRAGRRARRRRALGRARTGSRRPARSALPQVVSLGALDMVNFGPRETVPRAVRGPEPLRPQPDDHADADDARTSAASSAGGSARKLSAATGPAALFVPLRGVSVIAVEGGPFHDPAADEALLEATARDARRERRGARARRRRQRPGVRRPPWPTGCTSMIEGGDDPRARRSRGCARRSTAGRPIIGAGAGTGLSAKCAEAGGADLIIIYNSGRYRMAGRGSLAGLLPYGDANAIVVEMAARGAPDREATRPCWPASAAPTRSG